jgi:hypothetical protein
VTRVAADCPNCGAPVEFRWAGAVQTTCAYCRSVLVRHDVRLERVGEVAELPLTGSPIQLGTEGRVGTRSFGVVGRIVYEYARGGWNEWHLVFNDGASGWLSDAQLQYAVSFLATTAQALPTAAELRPGARYRLDDSPFEVATLTRARYRGVQGELPFEYWDKDEVLFADLASSDGRFATIDYSEATPLLFLGEYVDFDALRLTSLRQFDGW